MSIKLFTAAQVTVTTAGTRVQISSSPIPITSLVIQSDPDNTGYIFVGDDAVAIGQATCALEASRVFSIDPDASGRAGQEEYLLSDFWVDSTVNGNKVYVSYVKRR